MKLMGFSPWPGRQGLKPSECALSVARLKPCPDTRRPASEFKISWVSFRRYLNLMRRSATATMCSSIQPWLQRWILVSP